MTDSNARGPGFDIRPVRPNTFVSPSADSKRAVVSYCQLLAKVVVYVHEVLVNRLGSPSLPRKSVV